MSIVEKLKRQIAAKGGSTTGIHTIGDAIVALSALEVTSDSHADEHVVNTEET